eukprot:m.356422 g.356422  ORF g.356422 m.356422 type:complete len:331 (+) comp17541_c0_seq1:343-1335(+)
MHRKTYIVNETPADQGQVQSTSGTGRKSHGGGSGRSVKSSRKGTTYNLTSSAPGTTSSMGDGKLVDVVNTRIGVYGWRKYCLYCSVLFMVALAIVNLGLLVFLFRVLKLDRNSAGPLEFLDDSLIVRGKAEFTQGLLAANVSGFNDTTLLLEGNSDVIARSVNTKGDYSELRLDEGAVTLESKQFIVKYDGQTYLEATEATTRIAAREVVVQTASGMHVSGAVQASQITNNFAEGSGLTLESVGQALAVRADGDVSFTSETGTTTLQGLLGVTLESQAEIQLVASKVVMTDLPADSETADVYSLCLCPDGTLFRAAQPNPCDAVAATMCP